MSDKELSEALEILQSSAIVGSRFWQSGKWAVVLTECEKGILSYSTAQARRISELEDELERLKMKK